MWVVGDTYDWETDIRALAARALARWPRLASLGPSAVEDLVDHIRLWGESGGDLRWHFTVRLEARLWLLNAAPDDRGASPAR